MKAQALGLPTVLWTGPFLLGNVPFTEAVTVVTRGRTPSQPPNPDLDPGTNSKRDRNDGHARPHAVSAAQWRSTYPQGAVGRGGVRCDVVRCGAVRGRR